MSSLNGWYARRRDLRTRQIVIDLVVVCWVVVCAVLGAATAQTISAIASPLHGARDQAQNLGEYARQAAEQSSQIPAIGDGLSKPFASAGDSLRDVAGTIDRQIVTIGHAALLLGWLVFAIPVALALFIWLPARVRFRRRALATEQLLNSGVDLDLFALRALATQPLHLIATIGHDPLNGWRQGDADVIRALAEVELRTSGVRLPDQ